MQLYSAGARGPHTYPGASRLLERVVCVFGRRCRPAKDNPTLVGARQSHCPVTTVKPVSCPAHTKRARSFAIMS